METSKLKFYPMENNVKKTKGKKIKKYNSPTVQNTSVRYCPYCFTPVNSNEKFCPNCDLPVPDKNYRIEDSGSSHSLVLNLNDILHNITNKIEPPPPVSIKTSSGNELTIKPILTERAFVNCSLPYTRDRQSGYCSLRKFTVIDFETANMYPDSVCQIGIAVVEDNEITEAQSYLIRPPYNDFRNKEIHGIDLEKVKNLLTFAELWTDIKPYIENNLIGAYNAKFDIECLFAVLDTFKIEVPDFAYFDVLQNIREHTRENKLSSYRLAKVTKHFGIGHNPHDALNDVIATAKVQFECEMSATPCFIYAKNKSLIHLFAGDVILSDVRRQLREHFDRNDCQKLVDLVDIATRNGADDSKCLKLQGEIFEKCGMKNSAIEKYKQALSLNDKIGLKSKIQKLEKELRY